MKRKKKGFTIIEMVAALAMITIIIAGVSSLILVSIKQSAINSKTLDSNDASKSFLEMAKNNRVEYPVGTYSIYFDNLNELKIHFDKFKNKNISDGIYSVSNGSKYAEIKACNFQNKNSALKVNVVKNDIEKTYEFKITTWNLDKGEFTEVSREYILAQGR